MPNDVGVIIESGAQDWQIFQQDRAGTATVALRGRWLTANPFKTAIVLVRAVREDTGEVVSRALNWRDAETRPDGTWSIRLDRVPAGGLYRIETGLQLDGAPVEWPQRGDMAHHLGVGDIWVITGQSNAAGYGKTPAVDPPELGIHMFHARGRWELATHPLSDSTASRYVANREGANGSQSPWIHFARVLKRELGYPIGLIPASLGGSPLSAWVRSVNGILFTNMLQYVRDAGGSGACRGVVWYQGESDSGKAEREVYLARFAEMVADLRKELRNPDLPVLTAQLNRYVGEAYTAPVHEGWDVMREIQRQAPRKIPGVYVISTLDLSLSDGIHNDSRSNLVIGERMASLALGQVFGRDVKCLHPDLKEARVDGDAAIELVFDHVDTRLHFEDNIPEQFPFAVQDGQGRVPVKGWKFAAKDCLRIELGRALSGKATVIGAPTACPPYIVPFDICGYRPMLGFTADVRPQATPVPPTSPATRRRTPRQSGTRRQST